MSLNDYWRNFPFQLASCPQKGLWLCSGCLQRALYMRSRHWQAFPWVGVRGFRGVVGSWSLTTFASRFCRSGTSEALGGLGRLRPKPKRLTILVEGLSRLVREARRKGTNFENKSLHPGGLEDVPHRRPREALLKTLGLGLRRLCA